MSTPQSPSDDQPGQAGQPGQPNTDQPGSEKQTYVFGDMELDFDPYRFGRPDEAAVANPVPGRPAGPGQQWPGGGSAGQGSPEVPQYAPGDYWGAPPATSSSAPAQPSYPPPSGSPYDAPPGYRTPGNVPIPPLSNPYSPYAPPSAAFAGPGGPPASNGMAVAGFVVGLLSVVLFWTYIGAIILGAVGLALSLVGLSRSKRRQGKFRGLAIWGIVLSAVGMIAGAAVLVWVLTHVNLSCVANSQGSSTSRVQQCLK